MRSDGNQSALAGLLLSMPAFVGLAAFVAMPFLAAVILSCTDAQLNSPLAMRFVGTEQYRRLLSDPMIRRALANNLVFAAVVVPVQTVLALLLAVLLELVPSGKRLFRVLLFLPVVFPMSLIAVVWILLYAPGETGPMNRVLSWLTLGGWEPRDFLRDPQLAFPAIILLSLWQGVGLQMVILSAALSRIPKELYEAAAIDRAGAFAQFRHITLPQLRNPLVFTMLLTTILAFRLFEQVRIMTHGGPGDATRTLLLQAVESAFDLQQIGEASALSVVLFCIVLCISVLQQVLLDEGRRS
ncbi:MAG: sugar ABC transporter permease [Bdellovibrionales bacterium]|nr:sugar ABC transporter permease [Bdellovibrionales bacterium]